MLSSFYIQNFRSILELKLDFSYGEGKAPNGYHGQEIMPFLEAGNKKRLVPCAAFFGSNAAGKTNILKAFATIKTLLREGGKLADVFEPNLLNRKFTETTFETEFILGADQFNYRISYSATAIGEESLLKNGEPLFTVRQLQAEFGPKVHSTTYTKEKLSDIIRVECSDGEGRQTKAFLHRIGLAYQGLNPDLKNAFAYFQDGVRFFTNEGAMLLPVSVQILAEAMGGDKEAALREITDFVRRLDIDIAAINITETELGPEDRLHLGDLLKQNHDTGARHAINITATHKNVAGSHVPLNFIKHESAGTQRLAGLIGLILHALKTGGIFLVDELECSLHPLLMREIVLLFKKRRYNDKGAQLIFTTHNTDILDDSILRLSEIALVRKTVANGTLVRRLVDAKKDGEDIRNVTNFRKQYLAGFYSGVPHPAL
ncbi:MAG: ATP-binding protein [Opitutus sp.]|nr:ATP-binding protein [Opitutus sp.]MCS6247260.1 ATP-binding protein [Opitutus sp.]MCS6275114.1 ATP-binding protein [Opitutus sp.]MCS6278116.1 ATP-binding protein [Opitutus sp.]MCS6299226.1 ATP-binding protein [Opitutus sp.]